MIFYWDSAFLAAVGTIIIIIIIYYNLIKIISTNLASLFTN